MAESFREDHRLYQYRWFQLFPALCYCESIVSLLATHRLPAGSNLWTTLLGPFGFVFIFASSGYRVVVDEKGLSVHGLGLFALHEAALPFIWKWAGVPAADCRTASKRQSWLIFRWFGFPAFTLGRRPGMALSLGTPEFVRILNRKGRPFSLGTRRPDELVTALLGLH